MAKNIAVTAAASVLLVAIIVAILDSNDNGKAIAIVNKSIETTDDLCEMTSFVDACKRVMLKVKSAGNTTEVIHAASSAVEEEINNVLGQTDDIKKTLTDPANNDAMELCKRFIIDGLDDLRAVILDASNIKERPLDLRNWMTGVLVDVRTCIDAFDMSPDLKKRIETLMGNTTELMSNAMTIITALGKVFSSGLGEALEGLDFGDVVDEVEEESGRSLGEKVDSPSWMPAADRRMLATPPTNWDHPDVVVAQDGTGDVKTIMEAVNMAPRQNGERFLIYVKAGTYNEQVEIPTDAQNIFMYGDGGRKTVVTGDLNVNIKKVLTTQTASFIVNGKAFVCKKMGFINTAGPEGNQAVALRVHADRAAFFNCRIEGYQDTLYCHKGQQFYSNCYISGTIDFIFGSAAVVIQNSLIVVRKPMQGQFNAITADGRKSDAEHAGIIIHNSKIVPEKELFEERKNFVTYLGRPWQPYAKAVFMECEIGDVVSDEGWMQWMQGTSKVDPKNTFLGEYNNYGPGADRTRRVKWSKKDISRSEAMQFTVDKFLQGSDWVIATGAPGVIAGLKKERTN